MFVFLIVVLALVAVVAPLLRRRIRSEQPKPPRRWQIFVPRARIKVITRHTSELADVEIRAMPDYLFDEKSPNTAYVFDTDLLERPLLRPNEPMVHVQTNSLFGDEATVDIKLRGVNGVMTDMLYGLMVQPTSHSILITGTD